MLLDALASLDGIECDRRPAKQGIVQESAMIS